MEPKLFYQQPAARVGDVIPKYIDGKYQLFYLKNWRDHNAPGFVPGWHRMETTDLVHMGPESPIGVVGGTGDLIQEWLWDDDVDDTIREKIETLTGEELVDEDNDSAVDGSSLSPITSAPTAAWTTGSCKRRTPLAPMGRSTTAPTGGTPGSSTGRTWGSIGCTWRPG